MNLSVIIPAYQDLAGVLTCINSLRAMQSTPVSYYVQDDCSPSVLFQACIPVELASVERNAVNLGFAGNCNAGAARAAGDIFCFINQDIQAVYGWSEGWDTALLAAFENPRVGIVGARLLFPNGTIQSAGGEYDQLSQPVHRCLGWSQIHHPEVATPRAVEWVTGAAFAIRANVFKELNGFDTAYAGGYFEDVDLCLRAREIECQVMYEPRCTLVHAVGSTGGNPRFLENARLFRERWIDTRKVKAGAMMPTFRYW